MALLHEHQPGEEAVHAQWSPLDEPQTCPGSRSASAGAHLLGHPHRTRSEHCLGGSIAHGSPT